ncbi:MAG: NuoF family protein [Cyanobacteriota bacterium]
MTIAMAHPPGVRLQVRCCTASGCRLQGSDQLWTALQRQWVRVEASPGAALAVRAVGCLGLCGSGPLLAVDGGRCHGLYSGLSPEQIRELMACLILDAEAPGPQAIGAGASEGQQQPGVSAALARRRLDPSLPFLVKQRRLVLQHCGWIEPESIAAALAVGTYRQLLQCLDGRSPAEVRAMIRRSGLRGRGGAGYPTGLKWDRVAAQATTPKLVVANGDEGDPGAFMDRTVMESDPHRLLEGLAIAAFAVGADRGVLFVRAEYPQAVIRLRRAIAEAEAHGLLGDTVGGRPFGLRITLRVGAGAYVCGEETALMAAIEGRRGLPRPRPPYPARCGLWKKPTLINNVETLAAIPAILAIGPEAYAAIGTDRSRGTKVFSLSGAIRHSGVVEVPMGISLRCLVEEIGGGAPSGRRIKAVQTGGPAGGFVPARLLDVPIAYETMADLGTAIGSGGLVVIADDTSIPELVAHFLRFCASESCGKCVPCRAGTVQLVQLLEQLRAGEGVGAQALPLARLAELATMVRACSLCGLGQGAPNPLLSSLRHFQAEYVPGTGSGADR